MSETSPTGVKFLSNREIIDDILSKLPESSIIVLNHQSRSDLIKYHTNWARNIRNGYNMWVAGNPYSNLKDSMHDDFPDQRSGAVIEGVWELIKLVETK